MPNKRACCDSWESDSGHRLSCPNANEPVSMADVREVFATGAHRSNTTAGATNPTDYSQFSHVAARLHAETQAEGNAKYGYGNWQKGIPVSNCLSHALAHIFAILNGDVSENHLGHAIWNLDKAAHFIGTRPELVDVVPLRRALKLDETVKVMKCCVCGAQTDRDSVIPNGCLGGEYHYFQPMGAK